MKNTIPIIVFGIFLIIAVSVTWYVTVQRTGAQTDYYTTQSEAVTQIAPTIADIPMLEQTYSQPSPDGKKKLAMHVKPMSEDTREYTFSTTDSEGENPIMIYRAVLTGEKFMIPFNTWSPDNKYVFIQKETGEAYVFKQNGEAMTADQQYLDIKGVYENTPRKGTYRTVTGWASPTLLIINTVKEDQTKGSSYWFEVPFKAIIQLSGDF